MPSYDSIPRVSFFKCRLAAPDKVRRVREDPPPRVPGPLLLQCERKADLPLMSLGWQYSLDERRRASDGAAKEIGLERATNKASGGIS